MNTLEDDSRALLHTQADPPQVPDTQLGCRLTLTRATPRPRSWPLWMLALVLIVAVVFIQLGATAIAVVTTPPPMGTTPVAEVARPMVSNGWVAFTARREGSESDSAIDTAIYLVREGASARRIGGSERDGVAQACPAFSPEGMRLAYGQAVRTPEGNFHDAALVIADVTASGEVSATTTIALDDQLAVAAGESGPPCPTWSAEGRWLAFGAGSSERRRGGVVDGVSMAIFDEVADGVWVADTTTGDIRQLPEVSGVTDIEWAPDAADLYIASDGGIKVYSLAADETRDLADPSWGVEYVAASPDGQTLAVQGRRDSEARIIPRRSPTSYDLRLMDVDGNGEHRRLVDRGVISQDFDQMHGLGPIWSPDGKRIAFQRSCDFTPNNRPCLEESEVVVVTVNDHGPRDAAESPPMLEMDQAVIPPPTTTGPHGGSLFWYPLYVIWSPDSTTLLYGAWKDGDLSESLLAVPAEGGTPPVVLYEGSVVNYLGILNLNFQSWTHQQD